MRFSVRCPHCRHIDTMSAKTLIARYVAWYCSKCQEFCQVEKDDIMPPREKPKEAGR